MSHEKFLTTTARIKFLKRYIFILRELIDVCYEKEDEGGHKELADELIESLDDQAEDCFSKMEEDDRAFFNEIGKLSNELKQIKREETMK